ncbi:hypothetical protein Tco_0035361, partial [Tanacetum coccineum]
SDEEDDNEVNMGNDNDDDVDNQDDVGQDYDEQDDDNQDDDDQEHDGQDDEKQDDLSTHDEEDKEEEDSDPRVYTPSNYESTDDEESDEEIQGANVKGEEIDKEETNEEDEANELYKDVNVNLEGRDIEMTDAPRTIVQTTQVIEDTHVIITPANPEAQQQSSSVSFGFVSNMLNPSPDTGIDSIFNLNTESTLLIDVPVTTIAEPPFCLQQLFLHHPHLSSHFCNKHQSLHQQLLQAPPSVSSIPSIVDVYLANKMHEAIKTAV